MQNVAPETGRHHNIRQRLPAAFFQPAADLRAALAAQREAKHARASRIEDAVRRHWSAGMSTGRIAVLADCSTQAVRDAAKRLGLRRGGS